MSEAREGKEPSSNNEAKAKAESSDNDEAKAESSDFQKLGEGLAGSTVIVQYRLCLHAVVRGGSGRGDGRMGAWTMKLYRLSFKETASWVLSE